MAKKQTRRSVSLNRSLYEHAKVCAESDGVPLSQFVEAAIRNHITYSQKQPAVSNGG